ncbi:hypothetical protein [Streptomyces sviceus]|uniref:hypothetical protein n=1 Tax=Streptomyces sviceus TaxID=285530 RepID=UPI0036A34058
MQGLFGVKRLTDYRNGFKHTAGFPGSDVVLLARADTRAFFVANTPLFFGIEFDEIDLSVVVQQEDVRQRVQRASDLFESGDSLSAMGTLAFAFEEMITTQLNEEDAPYGRSVFAFGPGLSHHGLRVDQVRRILHHPDMETRRGLPGRAAESLAREITEVREVARSMQEGLRVMALGIDFLEYRRFLRLTPDVSMPYGQVEPTFHAEDGYAPSVEEFSFCRHFLITVALRLAEINRSAQTPSWYQANQ